MKDYRLVTTYAVGLVVVDQFGMITGTAPIFQRFKGRALDRVRDELKRRGRFVSLEPLLDDEGRAV
ncbi:MAG: hypothetical protein ACE5I7_19305 [Candidatus Binatia bacterium]